MSPKMTAPRWISAGLIGLLHLALALPVQAQAPAPAAPAPSPAQSLAYAQAQLARSQALAASLQEEVVALDGKIDARVDEIVGLLSSVQDSTETKTEVMNVKKDAIESLQRWVKAYAQERGRRLGQLQGRGGSAAARADLQQQVENIDAELNGRVDQIVELAASMSTSEDVERYETYYADWGVAKVETDEYRANKRQVSRADQTQSGVAEELEKAIAGIERDIALVPQRLPRDRQQAELDRLQKLLDERNTDLRALATAYPAEERQVGDREADQLERDLRSAEQDIRALWTQLLAKANSLSGERQRVRQLEARVNYLAAEIPPAPAAPPAPATAPAAEIPPAPAASETPATAPTAE